MPSQEEYRIRIFGDLHNEKTDLEVESALEFYRENADPGNRQRDFREILKAVQSRDFFVIEDKTRELVGVSLTYEHANGVIEAGGTRIIANGFGFQKILHCCRTINSSFWAKNNPSQNVYFCFVAADNMKSIHSIEKCGFERWEFDEEMVSYFGKLPREYDKSKTLAYRFELDRNSEMYKRHAATLMRLLDNPEIVARGTQKRAKLTIDIPLLRLKETREAVRSYADGASPLI